MTKIRRRPQNIDKERNNGDVWYDTDFLTVTSSLSCMMLFLSANDLDMHSTLFRSIVRVCNCHPWLWIKSNFFD